MGYEGLYEVSDHGNVKSLDRKTPHKKGGHYTCKGKQLKPQKQTSGHQHVTLCNGGVMQHQRIHRIVLAAFVGPCPEGKEVCHIDGDPTNNSLRNLRYGTRKENVADAIKHGTFKPGTENFKLRWS